MAESRSDWKLVIEVEDNLMDSGCLYDILQTCANHGKVLVAKTVHRDGHENDLLEIYEPLIAEKGKC